MSKTLSQIKLTTRGQYAVTAMIQLAEGSPEKPVPLSDIAIRTKISLSYLEQLTAGLKRNGLVKSYRGPGGGYILDRPPAEITVAEILLAAEDSTPARRNRNNKDIRKENCPATFALWTVTGEVLNVLLRQVSLEEMMGGRFQSHKAFSKLFEILG